MFQFVDRISEQARIKKALSRKGISFLVIYGRRRCGKSRLIKQVLSANDVYFMADQSEAIQQRTLLARVISNIIPGFDKITYPDWDILFENLNARLRRKMTLCLDQFPYLVKNSPELPSILQKLLDNRENIKFNLLICGSSQQLMQGLVMDSTAPLFGRADEIIKIKPINVPYIQNVLHCSDIEAIEEYSIWGGVPRYWELRATEKNLFDAVKYHLLSSQGILYDEPVRMFLDDMRDTVHSFTLLSLVAGGCHRLSEIAARIEKPATSLSAPLEKLIDLGYLEKEIPFGENPKNSKKSLYHIADPFLRFYFKYVVPNRSFIETERSENTLKQIKLHFSEYVSFLWEKVCRDTVPNMVIKGKKFKNASRWWGKINNMEMELDVVAEGTDEKYILVGECKWNSKDLNEEKILSDLMDKAQQLPFVKDKIIIPVLFLKKSKKFGSGIYSPKNILKALK
ncbi:MAG: ATP-binding protein [Bacteroidales bacterium]|jgi:AAA+ ATPase superfamily predicted ATPase|nr:ATP-binding protein [Bacteroidales bacterium]